MMEVRCLWSADSHLSHHLQLQGVVREIPHSLVQAGETVGRHWDFCCDDAVYLRHWLSSRIDISISKCLWLYPN